MDYIENKTCLVFIDITDNHEAYNVTTEYIMFTRGATW